MDNQIVTFNNPPLTEMVLSLQFTQFDSFSNAHGGWFWKNYLSKEWKKIQQASLIADQYERFGDLKKWGRIAPSLKLIKESEAARLQITTESGDRMIQVQPSRFVYNWRKNDSDYPRFNTVTLEYNQYFDQFKQFVIDSELGEISLNQWEITYVNHILKNHGWDTLKDMSKLFPDFYLPVQNKLDIDNLNCNWSLIIGDNQGRLHIDVKHVRLSTEFGPEAILLQLVARGPVESSGDYTSGFKLGHDSIVNTFTDMTSKETHAVWDRTD